MTDTDGTVFEEFGPEELATLPRSQGWRSRWLAQPQRVRALRSRDEGGAVLAELVALRIPARLEGGDRELLQVVHLARPGLASGLQRESPVEVLAREFCGRFAGLEDEQAPLVYGVPDRPSWRLAKERLDAKLLRTVDVLFAPADAFDRLGGGPLTVEESESFPPDADELRGRAAEKAELLVRPTRAALDERFAGTDATLGLVRRGGTLEGYAVFRTGTFDGRSELGLVLDWCTPDADTAVGGALLRWLVERASAAGCEELVLVLPETRPEWGPLQEAGLRIRGTSKFIAARHFPRQLTMRWLYHRWSYGLCDLDPA